MQNSDLTSREMLLYLSAKNEGRIKLDVEPYHSGYPNKLKQDYIRLKEKLNNIKTKNDALLNCRDESNIIQYHCKLILTERI